MQPVNANPAARHSRRRAHIRRVEARVLRTPTVAELMSARDPLEEINTAGLRNPRIVPTLQRVRQTCSVILAHYAPCQTTMLRRLTVIPASAVVNSLMDLTALTPAQARMCANRTETRLNTDLC